ncbi:MAG: class I SAM-dependent methyltransferase [Candidatus Babeliales bacterium]
MKQFFRYPFLASLSIPKLAPVPTMITDDEKKYLYWLARDSITGQGAIVEIGTWFGCSVGYLGAGLRDAGKNVPVHCFDRFELQGIEKKKARQQGFEHIESLAQGADIMPVTAAHLRDIYPIHLHKTYIDAIVWDAGLVELLHLDAPKRASDIVHVLKTFVPFFIPGKTILVLQDFGMPRAYALPLIFGHLHEYFELVTIPFTNSTMALFSYKKVLENSKDTFEKSCKSVFDSWPIEYVQKIWHTMAAHYTDRAQKAFFNFGLALYFFRRGDKELAVNIARENAPYLALEKALLLEKRLCTSLWKSAFKK